MRSDVVARRIASVPLVRFDAYEYTLLSGSRGSSASTWLLHFLDTDVDGAAVGDALSAALGALVGAALVGAALGALVGALLVGALVCALLVREPDGATVGCCDRAWV